MVKGFKKVVAVSVVVAIVACLFILLPLKGYCGTVMIDWWRL